MPITLIASSVLSVICIGILLYVISAFSCVQSGFAGTLGNRPRLELTAALRPPMMKEECDWILT